MPPRIPGIFALRPRPNQAASQQVENADHVVDMQDARVRGDYLNRLWDEAGGPTLSGNQNEYRVRSSVFGVLVVDDEPAFTQVLNASLFHSVQATTLPAQSKNAKALSEIAGFDCNDIPDHLCCLLSREIMDDPVFDPNHPAYKFERAWIEKRLVDKQENPFTRTHLLQVNLVSDNELKTKINLFMQSVQHDTFCDLKSGF